MATGTSPFYNRPASKHLTVDEFCDELGIARSTFDDWRAKERAPVCLKLPNGKLRIRRSDYENWLDSCVQEAAA